MVETERRAGTQHGKLTGMAGYDALRDHLRRQRRPVITLTLKEISEVTPGGLPAGVYRYQAWWSNETAGSHAQARSRHDAAYTVASVDIAAGTATFHALHDGRP